jgi:predicted Holliday junction resolvase-like endonuclease
VFVGLNKYLLVLLALSGVKIYMDSKTITSLNQSVGEKNQQLVQYEATIASLSASKANTDKIAEEMYKRIDENAKASKTALQEVLRKAIPKDCKGSIEYLKSEAANVKFD